MSTKKEVKKSPPKKKVPAKYRTKTAKPLTEAEKKLSKAKKKAHTQKVTAARQASIPLQMKKREAARLQRARERFAKAQAMKEAREVARLHALEAVEADIRKDEHEVELMANAIAAGDSAVSL